jgi:hypothetical protein
MSGGGECHKERGKKGGKSAKVCGVKEGAIVL